jgi:hypothetical protein
VRRFDLKAVAYPLERPLLEELVRTICHLHGRAISRAASDYFKALRGQVIIPLEWKDGDIAAAFLQAPVLLGRAKSDTGLLAHRLSIRYIAADFCTLTALDRDELDSVNLSDLGFTWGLA